MTTRPSPPSLHGPRLQLPRLQLAPPTTPTAPRPALVLEPVPVPPVPPTPDPEPSHPKPPPTSPFVEHLRRRFDLDALGTTVGREVLAGVATFVTIAYILFLNPAILGSVSDGTGARLGADQALAVTALAAAACSIAMGLVANLPFVLAAGLGLNAFVAFTLVGTLGLSWPQAMGLVVVEGVILVASVVSGLRESVADAIPDDLKRAIVVGIGLFIAFVGLVNAGVVVKPEGGTIVALSGDLAKPQMLVFVMGVVFAAALLARKVRGALLASIGITTVLAIMLEAVVDADLWAHGVASMPTSLLAWPDLSLVGNVDLDFVSVLGLGTTMVVLLALLLSDFFDTIGTSIGLLDELEQQGAPARERPLRKVLLVDSFGALFGGVTSSSSNTVYVESATGIVEGGRSGLTAVVTGCCFAAAMFLAPIVGIIPAESTAAVLVVIGALMFTGVTQVTWDDPAVAVPALLVIAVMPFTYSITNGVGAGLVTWALVMLAAGRRREVPPLVWACCVPFTWYFVSGAL